MLAGAQWSSSLQCGWEGKKKKKVKSRTSPSPIQHPEHATCRSALTLLSFSVHKNIKISLRRMCFGARDVRKLGRAVPRHLSGQRAALQTNARCRGKCAAVLWDHREPEVEFTIPTRLLKSCRICFCIMFGYLSGLGIQLKVN